MTRARFWTPEFRRKHSGPKPDRKGHRWCSKCLTWVRKRVTRHHCDQPKRNRYCPVCETYVGVTVKRHRCDEPPDLPVVPWDTPERRCSACRFRFPEHETFFSRRSAGWYGQCRACREKRRIARQRRKKRIAREARKVHYVGGMKTPEEIDAVYADVLRRLPKYMYSDQVRIDPFARERGKLRVLVAHKLPLGGTATSWSLVGEWCHGVCGWLQWEYGQEWSREIAAVQRAVKAATKAAP